MQKAQTRAERKQVRDAMHALVEERAREKGVALPPGHPHGARQGSGPGYGPRGGYGAGPAWGRLYDQVFTREEREVYRAKMQAATTPEERANLWRAQRELAEQRARDRGIELPPQRASAYGYGPGMGHGPGDGQGSGMDRGPGGGGGAYRQLFTPEERDAFRTKMRKATTPEERARLWNDQRTLAEQRAKDKGITLPADRGPGSAPPGQGRPAPSPADSRAAKEPSAKPD
jgi:hypothetical protein